MAAEPTPSIKIFYCYARKDQDLRDELDTHLWGLHRSGLVESWYDGSIMPGTPWEEEIEAQLDAANIILLLISPDFIRSDYCYSKEMTRAIARHDAGEAHVVPILLRYTDWIDAPFSRLQMLPTNVRPVKSWPDRDEAWNSVALGIRQVVNDLIEQYKDKERMEALRKKKEQERIENALGQQKRIRNRRVKVLSSSQQFTPIKRGRTSYFFRRFSSRNSSLVGVFVGLLLVVVTGLVVVYPSLSPNHQGVIQQFSWADTTSSSRTESTAVTSSQNTSTSNSDQQARQKDFEEVTKNLPTISRFQVDDGWHVSYLKPDRSCINFGKSYTASIKQNEQYVPCVASNLSYKNFALQVTMDIKGDAGGIIFRSHNNANTYYRLAMNVENVAMPAFTLLLCDKDVCSTTNSTLGKIIGNPVSTKVDKYPVTLTVITRDTNIDVYANGKFVSRFIDSANIAAGQIGVYAAEDSNETNVDFSNLKIWSLDK